MRIIFSIMVIGIIIMLSIFSASAQFLGQLSTAQTLNKGETMLGAYLGVYEDAFSVFGQFRHGIVKYLDFGFKMGMLNLDPGYGEGKTGLAFGGDVKYWFLERESNDPLDVSLGGGMEFLKITDYSLFTLGGNVIASYEFEYGREKSVVPYGRLNLRWERASFKRSSRWVWGNEREDWNDDDMGVALSLGADLKLSQDFNLVGELQIDDNVGFVAGANYGIF
ncbi:MAG: hypothetical protein AMJ73_06270 [candidate division Zixibacteria bacterium SM1_73]|nr:MAG: hypothetical protein AMJ73_06270 [candidate division Zixibacteria bacterium SM1_73]